MSDKKQTKTPVPTILTLTLADLGDEGTLLIQHGDLAHVRQFVYTAETDFASVIRQAMEALSSIENDPPVISDTPVEKAAPKAAPPPEPEPPAEPTVDIPVKKGKVAIPASYLKVTNGDPGTETYQQAVLIAGRLIDGKLWDGKCRICINDVDDAQRKLKHLSDKDLSLFTLEDFAQRVPETASVTAEAETPDEPETADAEDLPTDDDPALEEAATPELAANTNQPGLI